MQQNNYPRLFTIRAYCSKCHKLLMESANMSKRELLINWDEGVIGAAGIECKDCELKVPNFNIDLRIYNSATKREFRPDKFLPKPKNVM